jgi:MFS transporter, DHA3 family, macrolide efflux protein
VLGRQLKLLQEVQSFRLLALATVGSALGTWLAFVALTIDVYDRTNSAVWVSALLIADFLPAIIIGIAASSLVDRLPRRRLMIASDLVRVAIFAILPFANDPGLIVVLAAVAGFATGFFRPALYAGLPNLLPDEDLPHANSLLQTIENVAWAVGPVIGGLLVAATGPGVAYWINAVTFLVSAALLAGIPDRVLQQAQAVGRGYWRDIADGFSLVMSSRALLTVLAAWNVVMLGTAGANVAEVVLAKDTFDAGDFGYGLLVGVTGIGLALGSMLAGSQLEHRALATVYATSIGLVAIGMVGAAAAPDVWIAAASVAVAGTGNGAAVVCNALLVQRGAPDELRGRAFTLLMSSNYVVLGIGMIAAGPLTNELGPRTVWAIAGALAAVAALVGLVLARGIPAQAQPAAEPRVHREPGQEQVETARL